MGELKIDNLQACGLLPWKTPSENTTLSHAAVDSHFRVGKQACTYVFTSSLLAQSENPTLSLGSLSLIGYAVLQQPRL